VFPPQTPVGRIGEKALLRRIRSRIKGARGVLVGIGDDAAAVETGAVSLITTDSLVEGIHFPPGLRARRADRAQSPVGQPLRH
jgi:thiamine monophosphate kinase